MQSPIDCKIVNFYANNNWGFRSNFFTVLPTTAVTILASWCYLCPLLCFISFSSPCIFMKIYGECITASLLDCRACRGTFHTILFLGMLYNMLSMKQYRYRVFVFRAHVFPIKLVIFLVIAELIEKMLFIYKCCVIFGTWLSMTHTGILTTAWGMQSNGNTYVIFVTILF